MSSQEKPGSGTNPVVMERLIRLEEADRDFDLEFWERVGCEGRFEAMVAMLCDSLKLGREENPEERNAGPPRLQRSVERVEWR